MAYYDKLLGRLRDVGAPPVDNRVWYVSPTGTGASPGTAAAPASFTAALDAAADGRPMIIHLAAGIYTPPSGFMGVDITFIGVGTASDFRANGTFFTHSKLRFSNLKIQSTTGFNYCDILIYSCTGTGVTVRGGRAAISNTAIAGTVSALAGALVSVSGGSIATLTVSDASRAYVSAGATITNPSPAFNTDGNQHSLIVYGGAE